MEPALRLFILFFTALRDVAPQLGKRRGCPRADDGVGRAIERPRSDNSHETVLKIQRLPFFLKPGR